MVSLLSIVNMKKFLINIANHLLYHAIYSEGEKPSSILHNSNILKNGYIMLISTDKYTSTRTF